LFFSLYNKRNRHKHLLQPQSCPSIVGVSNKKNTNNYYYYYLYSVLKVKKSAIINFFFFLHFLNYFLYSACTEISFISNIFLHVLPSLFNRSKVREEKMDSNYKKERKTLNISGRREIIIIIIIISKSAQKSDDCFLLNLRKKKQNYFKSNQRSIEFSLKLQSKKKSYLIYFNIRTTTTTITRTRPAHQKKRSLKIYFFC